MAAAGDRSRRTKPKSEAKPAAPVKGLRRSLVENEILEQAAVLFAQRGYPGTTLQDLADALGMSRPALYYYVRSKEAIFGRLIESLSAENARALAAVRARRKGSPPEKLRDMAYEMAWTACQHPLQTRILVENRHHLPEDLAEVDRKAERSILRSMQATIQDGVSEGSLRAADTRTAALSIIGMCLWAAWWRGASDQRPEEVAAVIADQAVNSVAAVMRGSDRSDPHDVLRVVREDLDLLSDLI